MSGSLHIHGPGRAATSLAGLLERRDWRVIGASGGSGRGAEQASKALDRDIPWSPAPPTLPNGVWVIVGTPDDALQEAARDLAAATWEGEGLAFHLSGLRGRSILEPLADRGIDTAAVHPLRSFPSHDAGSDDLGGCLVALDVEPGSEPLVSSLVRSVGGRPFPVPDAARPPYHLGASVMSNGLLAVADLAFRCFREAGIPDDVAREALVRLATETLLNAQRLGAPDALTGPVARGDVATVQAHLETVEDRLPEDRSFFVALVKALTALAARAEGLSGAGDVAAWLENQEA